VAEQSEERQTGGASRGDDRKVALEQYRNVLGYLQYENTAYRTRSGFMLVAQAALPSPLARVTPLSSSQVNWYVVVLILGLATIGLMLCRLWWLAAEGPSWWIERWHDVLVKLEPRAYGDIEVFRGAVDITKQPPDRIPTKRLVTDVVRLFSAVWILVLAAGVGMGVYVAYPQLKPQSGEPGARPDVGRTKATGSS
jgi:hypothetical protein